MSSISSWYTQQYSGTFRNTRLRAPSLVPRNGGSAPIAQQTLVVDAARNNRAAGTDAEDGKAARRRETIFGPDVGEDDEPGWTQPEDGAKIGVDVIKGWVEKAKSEEGLHATTTLQALVNLKRPTLQLQQLEAPASNPSAPVAEEGDIAPAEVGRPSFLPSAPLHVLKFNYDATTPHVNVTLSIYPSPQPAVEGKESIQEEDEVRTIYTGTHEGGFNKVFNLPPSAAIDLSSAMAPMPSAEALAVAAQSEDKSVLPNNQSTTSVGPRETMSEDTTRSSLERSMGNIQISTLATVPETEGQGADEGGRGGRLGRMFGLRGGRREPDLEAGGQIEMADRAQVEGEKTAEEEDKEPEKGMRLLIKIEGVGAEGEALKRRNAQLTHILINGMWVPEAGSTAGPGQAGKRVWVVKVVRREAVIGAHTFLLKEIYGLSSASNQNSGSNHPPQDDPYASTPNECIVCLTSPRDVVLLPCRHLVVCRDCAVGMVEFGAGGKVARRDEGAGEETGTAAGGAGTPSGGATAAAPAVPVAGGTTTGGRERRKKKAKGWYCPVCRQPYTSLLRLALPDNAKPHRTPAASRMASRAPSIRSVHTTHTLHRQASRATLPDGAEKMLAGLRPGGADAESDEEDEEEDVPTESGPAGQDGRPQFVLGPEVHEREENKKAEVEHREEAGQATSAHVEPAAVSEAEVEGRRSEEGKRGWKQV